MLWLVWRARDSWVARRLGDKVWHRWSSRSRMLDLERKESVR
jgi:hypothetical protein